MNWLGHFNVGEIVTDKFTTTDLSGVPAAISNGVIRVYAGAAVSSHSVGVTIISNFAGNTGSNYWRVDTGSDAVVYSSVAGTSGANQYTVELTSGTVAGFTVRGYQVAKFTLGGQVVAGVSGSVTGNIVGNVSGTVGSVAGSVGGNVGGDVIGTVRTGVSGSVGFVQGNVLGQVVGGVSGNITGSLAGNVLGQVVGGVSGNITGTVASVVSGVNLSTVQGFSVQAASGFVRTNVVQWVGLPPAGLLTGKVQSYQSGNIVASVIGDVSGSVGFVQQAITATLGSGPAQDIAYRTWETQKSAVSLASGTFGRNVSVQSVEGNVVGSVIGNIIGNVLGQVVGGVSGNLTGQVLGGISGNITGSVASVVGNVGGSVGSVAGNVTGQVLGGVSGSVGFVQGAVATVTGAVGSVTGNVGGNVLGQVVGGVSGNLTGNVQGQVVGGVSGNITGSVASIISGVNVTSLQGVSIQAASGFARVNLTQWLGLPPAPLVQALVQTSVSGTVSATADALSSAGQDGIVNRYLNTSRTTVSVSGSIGQVFATTAVAPVNFAAMSITSAGRSNANVQEWLGVAPAGLITGKVQSYQSGNIVASIIGDVSGSVGFVQAASAASLTSAQADDIAERVWDMPRTRAAVSGTFGQSVLVANGVTGNVTGSVASVAGDLTGNVLGQVVGGVSGNITGSVASIVSGVNVTNLQGVSIQAASGFARVNLTQWVGLPPAPLVQALVQTSVSGSISFGTVDALTSAAQDGVINRYLNTSRTSVSVSGSLGQIFATSVVAPTNFTVMSITSAGRADANVQEWLGVAPAPLNAARVQTFQSGTVIGDVSGSVGFVQQAVAATFTSTQADDIAERVWDVPRTRATASGTFGQSVLVQNGVIGNLAGSVIGDISGSVGSVQGAVASSFTSTQADDIAERVWDMPRIRATVSGTFGQSVLVANGITGDLTGNVTGSVASVAGAVGSVTGAVGGKVLGGLSGEVGLQNASIKTTTVVAGAFDATVFGSEFLLGDSGSAAFYNAIADAHLDRADGIETGMTPRQSQRGIAATAMGLLSGSGTPNIGIRQAGTGSATRISAVVDQSGNRSTVIRNL
jgi:outer membrane lipoprotein SlyB